ncbi:YebC/PmpR family DNA-binding regulatory protein [Pontibacter ummariensis]|uniref:Probable transcriptional regulatory protein SAMN06296052_107150 n=1 Tax=Pontibacter ummariensis TaxID=1610492 RepID=A0A239EZJ9_9BACT|nr:YebC/PmpR family DNA-binding transcriptional regulator [Pontibacter ummariensis]PRY12667.1 YebC/PmpR family DNA-binding regulatory protein [Pontibacter ummariensis]SNS50059.1 DNA-binding regulatory protein, YebC/PmpR family [Pontibacter ummariensis]
MSGHSKWSTIKRKKGALDAKRSKIFTKLIKEITVAVKEGGGPDPDGNPRLRLAIQASKAANMPKDNIERAIKKGEGGDAGDYTEVTYEGYAPHGVAVFVECLTDNINRTVQNLRTIFNKNNGSLGTNGSVDFLFDRKGVFVVKRDPEKPLNDEELMLELIDAGAEEIEFEEEYVTIYSAMEDFGALQKKVEALDLELENAELQRIPQTTVKVEDPDAVRSVLKLIDAMEDDDDVQKVYHNLELSDEVMAELES